MEKYKRLTNKKATTENTKVVYNENGFAIFDKELVETLLEEHNRLWELETKIENGTLIEVPCKVGDKVYYVNEYRPTPRIEEYKVYSFTFDFKHEIVLMVENGYGFYKNQIFLTKAEAEQRIKELKEEE